MVRVVAASLQNGREAALECAIGRCPATPPRYSQCCTWFLIFESHVTRMLFKGFPWSREREFVCVGGGGFRVGVRPVDSEQNNGG